MDKGGKERDLLTIMPASKKASMSSTNARSYSFTVMVVSRPLELLLSLDIQT